MSIPSIEFDPTNGPTLLIANISGDLVNLTYSNDNSLMVSGATVSTKLFLDEFQPFQQKDETATAGWSNIGGLLFSNMEAGNYEVTVSFNWRTSTNKKGFLAEIVQDGDYDNPIWELNVIPKSANSKIKQGITKFIWINNLTGGSHSFDLWFACDDENKLAYMSDVYMKIERKS